MPIKKIIYLSITLLIVGIVLQYLKFGDFIKLSNRYVSAGGSLQGLIKSYPYTLLLLLQQFLNGDYLIIFANMAIGYTLGRIGFIEMMDKNLTFKHVILSLVLYFIFGVASYGRVYFFHISIHPLLGGFIKNILYYCGTAFYWILFIWLYNNVKWFHALSAFFESYGKCGLTNYSMQGIFGIIVFYFFGIVKYPYSIVFVYSILFFVLQALFCFLWLKKYKNGPLEYLWRCATEKKWLPAKL